MSNTCSVLATEWPHVHPIPKASHVLGLFFTEISHVVFIHMSYSWGSFNYFSLIFSNQKTCSDLIRFDEA